MKNKIILSLCGISLFLLPSCCNFFKRDKAGEEVKKVAEASPQVKGVQTLDSGLKYEVLKSGGAEKSPEKGKKVVVHYAGWLEDKENPGTKGRKFDSSVDRGQKFTFKIGVGQVIKGWDEGVMDMKVGEKRRLIIPHQLAYGERGIPGVIPEKSTLIFEVELFDVV